MIQVSKTNDQKKKRSLKGNISLLFIFILLASSTIVILAMTQIRHLMEYGETAFDYFKTYYLGKAGLELAFTETQTRGYGFNFVSGSGDAIITKNFNTEEGKNYFAYSITGRHVDFTETVKTGDFLTLPLFYDQGGPSHFQNLSGKQNLHYYNFATNIKTWELSRATTEPGLLMTFLVYNTGMTEMLDIVQKTGSDFTNFTTQTIDGCMVEEDNNDFGCTKYTTYLENGKELPTFIMIKNTSNGTLTFTGKDNPSNSSKDGITLLKSKIIVLGHYHDDEISLEAEYSKPIPGFFGASPFK